MACTGLVPIVTRLAPVLNTTLGQVIFPGHVNRVEKGRLAHIPGISTTLGETNTFEVLALLQIP